MNRVHLTAEELLKLPETLRLLGEYSDEEGINHKLKYDIARTTNYKKNIFYHATGGTGEIGLGQGLYLGKDKRALRNFYNGDGERGVIEVYKGIPNFLDLSDYSAFVNFEKKALQIYGKDKNNSYFRKLTLKNGYDGIRYFDPIATGEEFILFNTIKVKKIKHKNG